MRFLNVKRSEQSAESEALAARLQAISARFKIKQPANPASEDPHVPQPVRQVFWTPDELS